MLATGFFTVFISKKVICRLPFMDGFDGWRVVVASLRVGVLFVLMFGLTGCMPANQLRVSWHASEYVNPGPSHQSLSLVVDIYQLSRLDPFITLNFDDLYGGASNVLGASLLEQQQIWLLPGKSNRVILPMESGVHYIAVVANFNRFCSESWRAWVVVPKDLRFRSFDLSLSVSWCHVHLRLLPRWAI